MNTTQVVGKWTEMKGKLKQKWGKLTDDDMTQIEGKYDELVGRLQQRYGYEKQQAEKEAKEFYSGCGCH
jgi:uncharacterized protein YjbJ (UPF0337 family)